MPQNIDWGTYSLYVPRLAVLPSDLPRRDARLEFNQKMAARPERRSQLASLMRSNGLALDDDDEGLTRLDNFFSSSVSLDQEATEPDRLEPRWYSVVNDIGLFLGDVLISRRPQLGWELDVAKRSMFYHRAVISGFGGKHRTTFEFDLRTAGYGVQCAKGGGPDRLGFAGWVRAAEGVYDDIANGRWN